MDKLDVVLLMSVNPLASAGRSSSRDPRQAARRACADWTPTRRTQRRRILLEIDGGVKTDNIADRPRRSRTFVAGSAVFGAARAADPHRYDSILGALRAELAAPVRA